VAVWSVRHTERGVVAEPRATFRTSGLFDLAFHPSGSSLVYLTSDGPGRPSHLFRYDLARGGEPRRLDVAVRSQVHAVNFDTPGRLLTFITPDGNLGRWDWEKETSVPGADLPAFQCALAPGGRWAATSTPDRAVVIYDLDAGKRVLALPPEQSDVWGLAWAPDGQRLAVGLSDGVVAVWDLGRVRARLAEFNIEVPSMRPPP
jgi:WD40 repeat protein